jgi:hypothetical protein
MNNLRLRQRGQRVVSVVLVLGATTVATVWLMYAAFGHLIVKYAYGTDAHIVDLLMSGRASTPLQSYLDRADTLMLTMSLRAISALAVLAFLKAPRAASVIIGSSAVVLLMVITALEAKPSLAYAVGLDSVEYYMNKNLLVPDEEFVYRSKPLLRITTRQSVDARPFGVESPPAATEEWATDEEGFRNAHAVRSCDVVLVGDGMLNSGRTLSETFGSSVGKHLHRCVANLGVSGHGPFQFVRTFERYGLPKRPAYAVLAFNEGNDLQDVEKYNAWRAGSPTSFWGGYEIAISNPAVRLGVAARQAVRRARNEVWLQAASGVFRNSGAAHPLAGNLAWVRLWGQAEFPMVFVDRQQVQSAAEIRKTQGWAQLRSLLSRFRTLSVEHEITPVILFVPTAAHIYAQYSTERSGTAWLEMRDEQIRAKENLETAVARLSGELGMRFVSLTAPFQRAAKNGAVLYESFSVHLTPLGTDIGGAYLADTLSALDREARRSRARERSEDR